MTFLDSSHCTVVAGGGSPTLARIDIPPSSLPQPIDPVVAFGAAPMPG